MRLILYKYFVFVSLIFLQQITAYSNDSLAVSSSRIDVISDQSSLTVSCNIDSSQIFLDTNFVGVTPLANYHVKPGRYLLSVFSPGTKKWNRSTSFDSIVVRDSENISRHVVLENIYYINSIPSGAKVIYNDSLIGTTPAILSTKVSQNILTILKDGYQQASIPLENNVSSVNVQLIPSDKLKNNQVEYLSCDGTKPSASLYFSAGGTIVFGVAAALLKIQADNNYQKYRLTGDQKYLKKVKYFDVSSGISLAACEISSFILAYLLLSR
jgi:hypothetical protein